MFGNDDSGNGKALSHPPVGIFGASTPADYGDMADDTNLKKKCILFNGGCFQASGSGTYFTPQDMSIAFWIQGMSLNSATQTIASASSSTGGWILYCDPDGFLYFMYKLTNSVAIPVYLNIKLAGFQNEGDVSEIGDRWNHICIRVNPSKDIRAFFNGVLVYDDRPYSDVSYVFQYSAANLRLGGGNNQGTPNNLISETSKIADFRIYNRSLSIEEIQFLNTQYAVAGGAGVNSDAIDIINGGESQVIEIDGTKEAFSGGGNAYALSTTTQTVSTIGRRNGGTNVVGSSTATTRGYVQTISSSETNSIIGTRGFGANASIDQDNSGGDGVVIIRYKAATVSQKDEFQLLTQPQVREIIEAYNYQPAISFGSDLNLKEGKLF